jgi:hypothetical protein
MLTGTTPFTGSTPLAVAMKHSSEHPRPPREFVAAIPVELEEIVLHALEKRPEDRPPNANAFRRELYEIAERLGLEHAAGHSAPTFETLRNAGTETPSGRLVVDIARMRENRAASGDRIASPLAAKEKVSSADMTPAATPAASVSPATAALLKTPPVLSRLKISFSRKEDFVKRLKQPPVLIYIGLASLVLLIVFLTVLAIRSSSTPVPPATNNAGAMWWPAILPSVKPSPSVAPSPRHLSGDETTQGNARKQPDNRQSRRTTGTTPPPKGPSKVGKFFKKVKRVFKKPF